VLPLEATPETFYFDPTAFGTADDMLTALDLGESPAGGVAFDSGLAGSPAAASSSLPQSLAVGAPGRAATLFRALPFPDGGAAAASGVPPRHGRSAGPPPPPPPPPPPWDPSSMAVDRGAGAPSCRLAGLTFGRLSSLTPPPGRAAAAAAAATAAAAARASNAVPTRDHLAAAAAAKAAAGPGGLPVSAPRRAGLAALLRGPGPTALTEPYASAVAGLAVTAGAAVGAPPAAHEAGRAAWEDAVRRAVRAAAAAETASPPPPPPPPVAAAAAAAAAPSADALRSLLAAAPVREAGADALLALLAEDVVGRLLARDGMVVRVAAAASAASTAAAAAAAAAAGGVGPALAQRAAGSGRLVSAG